MAVFADRPEEWFTNRGVQMTLSIREVKHHGRRSGWNIAAVQDLVSDLVGRQFVSMRKAPKGQEWLYRFEKSLDPDFNGMLLP
jgi:hypothetical protein